MFSNYLSEIINSKISKKWNKKQKYDQILKRKDTSNLICYMIEIQNLGLNTGGNVDAIFMSFSPLN